MIMSLAINPLGSVSIATQATSISSIAQNQTDASTANATPVTLQQVPPASESPSLKAALKALGTAGKLASDLQDIASALVPSMQKIIADRPDLAMATFDFQSNNGSIKVVSSSLNDHDKAWLEQTLNANRGLVAAVQTFHSDATSSYASWAQADGQTLSSSDTAKVSEMADHQFSFMSMLQNASRAMAQNMDPNATYTTSSGATINFHQSVNSALSFLVFQKSNESVLSGTNTSKNGTHVYYGSIKGNFFSNPEVIPGFQPSMSSNSVGLDTMA
jgi:hypothetical protein